MNLMAYTWATIIGWIHFVSGELMTEEAVVGQILVEGPDHPVAIAPGLLSLLVEFEAIAFCKASHIEPVLGPALAIGRGREESVNDVFAGSGVGVVEKGLDFGRCWRKAGQVEGDPAKEGTAIGFRREGEPLPGKSCADEPVDRIWGISLRKSGA